MRRLCLCLAFLALPIVGLAEEVEQKPYLVLDAGGHTGRIWKVVFTPDDKQLISVSFDKTIRIWDVATGESVRVLRPPIGKGYGGMMIAADVSPDGKLLAVGGVGPLAEKKHPVYLISLANAAMVRLLEGHTGPINFLAFSPDGNRLASASHDHTARIWDVRTGRTEQVLRGHEDLVEGVSFSPDSSRVATAASDQTARIWSVASGKTLAVLRGHEKAASYVTWSPDGALLATGSRQGSIRLWEPNGALRQRYGDVAPASISYLTFTADGREIFYTSMYSTRVKAPISAMVDLDTGRLRLKIVGNNEFTDGALSHDGKVAAAATIQGEVSLRSTDNGVTLQVLRPKGYRALYNAAWGPEGSTVAWGTSYNAIVEKRANTPLDRAFSLEELAFVENPNDTFLRPCFSSGGRMLRHAQNADVLEVVEDGRVLQSLKMPEYTNIGVNSRPSPTAFSWINERSVAIGTEGDIFLFNTQSGKQTGRLTGHFDWVSAVVPAPQGRYLLSSSNDRTLRIWDLQQDEPLLSLFFAGDDWIAWTSEGYYACSPGGAKLLGWQVNNGPDRMASFYPADKFRKSLYRPDVIKRLLVAGSTEKALAQADQAHGKREGPTEVSRVLPPRVAITSPRHGSTLEGSEVRVEAVASSVGKHPVTALRLLLDGRPYAGQASLRRVSRPQLGEVKQSWTVTLTSSKHHLSVQADSTVSRGTSDEVEVIYQDQGGAEAERPAVRLHVLAIGINDYPDKLQLRCAADDARAVAKAFQEHSKDLYASVEVKVLTDARASRKSVLDSLVRLRKQMTQRDVAVVFFAGHGARDSEGSFYLLPADVDPDNLLSSAVSGEQVMKALAALPGRVLFMLDACHAGAAGGDKRRAAEPLTDELVQNLATDDYGVVIMCAAMGREFSLESRRLGHGYFTQALVEGLEGKAAKSGEGAIYLHHLDGYVTDRVKELTGGLQHPVTAKPTSIRSFPLSRP